MYDYHIPKKCSLYEKKYDTEAVFFMDDDLMFSKSRLREFCNLYKEAGLKIIWGCQARANMADLEILKLMKEANCKQITYGFEAGSQRILDLLKNNTTKIEQNKRAVRLTKEAGILACGSFMIGNPGETEEEIEMTKQFIIKNNLDGFGATITTPFPGTKLWQMCEEKGIIPKKIDWNEFNLGELTFGLSDISHKRMAEIHNEFLNLVFERNPGMAPGHIFNVALHNPKKAIKRISKDPKILLTVLKRIIRRK